MMAQCSLILDLFLYRIMSKRNTVLNRLWNVNRQKLARIHPGQYGHKYAKWSRKTVTHDLSLSPVYSEITQLLIKDFTSNDDVFQYTLGQDPFLLSYFSQLLGVPQKYILITSGADPGLHLVSHLLIDRGTKVLFPVPTFMRMQLHVTSYQGELSLLKAKKPLRGCSLEEIDSAVQVVSPSVVFLTNPNNPTGRTHNPDRLLALVRKHPGSVFIIDMAFHNFFLRPQTIAKFVRQRNTVVILSISKVMGVPGMRLGLILSSITGLLPALKNIAGPFPVTSLSLQGISRLLSRNDTTVKRLLQKRDKLVKYNHKLLQNLGNSSIFISDEPHSICLLSTSKGNPSLERYLAQHGVRAVNINRIPGLTKTNGVRIAMNKEPLDYLVPILTAYNT